MELALRRRLEGVSRISISQSRQTAEVRFADGARSFSPAAFRRAVDEAGVEVVTFRIYACGVIEQQEAYRWLIAGENRLLVENARTAPIGPRVCVSGRLDDRSEPYRVIDADVRLWTD